MIIHKNKSNGDGMIVHGTKVRALYLGGNKTINDLLGSRSKEG